MARAAWTREYALGRKISDQSTAKLMTLNPELQKTADKVKADYPEDRPRTRPAVNHTAQPALRHTGNGARYL